MGTQYAAVETTEGTVDAAPPVAEFVVVPPDSDELRSRLLDEIGRRCKGVVTTIEALRAMTERETLACGEVLSSILQHVNAHITETASALAIAAAASEKTTSAFIDDVQTNLQAQEATVGRVNALAGDIKVAVQEIGQLTRTSNLLAVNAKIEAARLGDSGRGFAVIADHMRQLSETIAVSSKRVGGATEAVQNGLPQVAQSASTLLRRTHEFVVDMQRQAQTAAKKGNPEAGAQSALDEILNLSNRALSHLQFQDPLAQKLSGITRELSTLEERARLILEGDTSVLPAAADESQPTDEPSSGEVNLF
jgi:methyl-accepting chemotaxis protein